MVAADISGDALVCTEPRELGLCPENNTIVPQQVEHADAKEGKVVLHYNLNAYYKPEGPDPHDEPDAQEEKEENSTSEYAIIELPCRGTLRQK